jgi:prepilin-type N-terminal cleavage/methylation domain-containing protein
MTNRLRLTARRIRAIRAIHASRDDRGMTLVEILVSMSLLGMVLAMAQGALILTQRTVTDDSARNDQGSLAQQAVGSMTRNLRTAILPKQLDATCAGCDVAAFIKGDGTRVEFYANLDNDYSTPVGDAEITTRGPNKVSYRVVGGELIETVQRPNPHLGNDYDFAYCVPGPGCRVTTRILARNVTGVAPLFTYYANDGSTVPIPLESVESRLKAVDSIDVVLTVKSSKRVKGNTVATRVTLPNADSLVQETPSP